MNVNALILTAAALTAPAVAQDTFENGANPSGWTFDTFVNDTLETTGGNPGGWLRNDAMATIPRVLCDPLIDSPFNGNFRQMGVTRITVDAITEAAGFGTNGAGGRDFTIVLRDTNGTPGDISDDEYAYFVGTLVPQVGLGWETFVFDIPSTSTMGVPAGWTGAHFGDPLNFSTGYNWGELMLSVDSVEFWWADPSSFGIFQAWDVGIDNVNIEAAGFGTNYCAPAVNSTGVAGQITVTGSAIASQNSLVLFGESLPNNAFGFFLTSQTQGFVMNPGGSDGHLCLGGMVGRYVGPGQIQNTGPVGEMSLVLDLTQTPTPIGLVTIQAGETWNFQGWHRDAVGGVATSNFTDGISILFL